MMDNLWPDIYVPAIFGFLGTVIGAIIALCGTRLNAKDRHRERMLDLYAELVDSIRFACEALPDGTKFVLARDTIQSIHSKIRLFEKNTKVLKSMDHLLVYFHPDSKETEDLIYVTHPDYRDSNGLQHTINEIARRREELIELVAQAY